MRTARNAVQIRAFCARLLLDAESLVENVLKIFFCYSGFCKLAPTFFSENFVYVFSYRSFDKFGERAFLVVVVSKKHSCLCIEIG